jgi:hypothetical protein
MGDESKAREGTPHVREDDPATPGRRTPGRTPTVFMTDRASESSRIAETLRAAGYFVLDVPLSMLVARAQSEKPNVVLVDVDPDGALDEVARVRKLPGGGAVDFVYFGNGSGTVRNADDALTHDGSAFFLRPVDVGALVRRIESLTGGPNPRPDPRPSTPPPSMTSGRTGSAPPERSSSHSLPAPGLRLPGPPLPVSTPSLADLVEPPRSFATFGTVSNELQQLLAEAELRAEVMPQVDLPLPTPEEEIEAVLPADVLASLDEPIEGDEDEEHEVRGGTGPGADREGTGAHAKGTTAGGHKQTTASGGRSSAPPHTLERRVPSDRPPAQKTPIRDLTTARRQSELPPPVHPPRPDRPTIPEGRLYDVRNANANANANVNANANANANQGSGTPRGRETLELTPAPPGVAPPPDRRPSPHEPRDLRRLGSASFDVESTEAIPSALHIPRLDSVTVATVDLFGGDGPTISMNHRPPRAFDRADAVTQDVPAVRDVRDVRDSRDARDSREPLGIVIMRPVDARRFLGDAIARRLTGAICFEQDRVVRRLVIRDGDLVTAASGAEQESLVCFLGARGELPRDEVDRLAGKIPPHGRHAGAALVAHGWLGQDQLWNVLRAHAEWIATSVLRLGGGTAQLEPEPPGRLRSEPSVFGASTGAEIFVELVRRAVSPEEAIEALGGEGSRISDGPMANLLAECALPAPEIELISRSRRGSIGELLARAVDPDIVAVVHSLSLLGVLDIVPSTEAARTPERSSRAVSLEAEALDDEAIRARVRARLELVEEGDYFAVLGVPRDATGYEVRRAFVELRRAFEPTRILSPRLVDLADDVRKIVIVLEEAYEILRDVARRERYQRAINARP